MVFDIINFNNYNIHQFGIDKSLIFLMIKEFFWKLYQLKSAMLWDVLSVKMSFF